MTKQKIVVMVGAPLVAIVLLAGGYALGHGSHGASKLSSSEDTSSSSGEASNNVMSLNPADTGSTSSSTGGLSVSASGAMDMGQLGNKPAGSATSGASGASGASSSSGSSSNDPSPNSFADYEKYKDQQHALFGDIVKGTGTEAVANKKLAVYYKGWLTSGTMFDQSPTTNGQKQPLIFTLGSHEVVPGMEEGVLGMKIGGRRLVLIPPAVGYGEKGYGPVPANSLMVFEVELLTVQ